MPSPFVHLSIAEKIRLELNSHQLSGDRLGDVINLGWSAFYLGSVAPDYQTLSGQARELTHFFKLPPERGNDAYPRMFSQYPQLAGGDSLPVDHAAFIAAYAAHLLLDLIWFREILIPYFHQAPGLGEIEDRWLLHLILLTYLDKLALEELPEGASQTLSDASPNAWLPYATDSDLRKWQDFLAEQLRPGAESQTVRIYAHRLQMTADTFAAKLGDPDWMQAHLFEKVPVVEVQAIVSTAVPKSIEVISGYVEGNFA